jgi:pimeloyl-ACP methyl ester carboxylesterase
MVDVIENDSLMYQFALDLLAQQGRTDDAEQLRQVGLPPYPTDELLGSFGASNDVLNDYMHAHARGEGTGHNLFFDSLGAPEYGLLDKVYWLLGLRDTFLTVYPQLYDLDFRLEAAQLEVPVYFVKGRWDVNAVNSLAEEYFALLDAPQKEWIWFEDSAHTPSWDEPAHFTDVMVNTVLAQTYPQTAEAG